MYLFCDFQKLKLCLKIIFVFHRTQHDRIKRKLSSQFIQWNTQHSTVRCESHDSTVTRRNSVSKLDYCPKPITSPAHPTCVFVSVFLRLFNPRPDYSIRNLKIETNWRVNRLSPIHITDFWKLRFWWIFFGWKSECFKIIQINTKIVYNLFILVIS